MTRSTSQAVTEVLQAATEPLTIAEIMQRIEPMQVLRTAKPKATVRSALFENARVATLGGRPARYVWWPKHLQGCCFRQSLAQMLDFSGQRRAVVQLDGNRYWFELARQEVRPQRTPHLSGYRKLARGEVHLRPRLPKAAAL